MGGFGCIRGPTNRGVPSISGEGWLDGKRVDDETEGLWRVHDGLYDLSNFDHPGGRFWINMTKGTDVTELFECSHPHITKARAFLNKMFVKKTKVSRNNGAYTFHEGGFYSTLRSRCWEILKTEGTGPTDEMLQIHDSLLLSFVIWVIALVIPQADEHWWALAIASGAILSCLGTCAHNFYHKDDNWRMYSWDMCLYSSNEWRITHCYSHHIFPNAINDYEISIMEPFIWWLPDGGNRGKKTWLYCIFEPLISQFLYTIAFLFKYSIRLIKLLFRKEAFRWEYMLPVAAFFLLSCVRTVAGLFVSGYVSVDVFAGKLNVNSALSPESLLQFFKSASWVVLKREAVMYLAASWVFHNVSLSAGHHHPKIWHEGDGDTSAAKLPTNDKGEIDWGIYQMCAVGDRPDVDKSIHISAVSYGMHLLHHLFPTVDQSKLPLLVSTLRQTCAEFIVTKPEAKFDDVDVARTAEFMKNRQLSVWEGMKGMLTEGLRGAPSNSNFIYSYRESLPAAKVSKK